MKPEIDFKKEERDIKILFMALVITIVGLGIAFVVKYADLIDSLMP